MENEKFLQSMVVLQEFLKELLAVGTTKFNVIELSKMWWDQRSESDAGEQL